MGESLGEGRTTFGSREFLCQDTTQEVVSTTKPEVDGKESESRVIQLLSPLSLGSQRVEPVVVVAGGHQVQTLRSAGGHEGREVGYRLDSLQDGRGGVFKQSLKGKREVQIPEEISAWVVKP